MSIINMEADQVWAYFQKKKASLLENLVQIAENPERDVVVFLSAVGESGDEIPDIIVNVSCKDFYEETCLDEEDCLDTVTQIYKKYINDIGTEEEDQESLEEECIESIEEDIDYALYDFFNVVLGTIENFEDARKQDYFEDCKEHFLEYMARKWDLEIYRPMYLEDESGEVFYKEYPYEYMEFEDEDNPVYYNSN